MRRTIWAPVAALISSISVGLAVPAHADEVDDYVYEQGPSVVCDRLDRAGVTVESLRAIGRYLNNQGFSDHDAAGIVWDSVQLWCPRYDLAVNAVAQYG
jgi:hypothetical protein